MRKMGGQPVMQQLKGGGILIIKGQLADTRFAKPHAIALPTAAAGEQPLLPAALKPVRLCGKLKTDAVSISPCKRPSASLTDDVNGIEVLSSRG